MSSPRTGVRSWGLAALVVAAGLIVPASAAGDTISATPTGPVTPTGSAAPVTSTPDALLAPRLMSQDRTDAAIAKRTQRPSLGPAAPVGPLGAEFSAQAPTAQLNFNGEDIATCCLRPPDTEGAVGISQFVETTNGEGVSVFRKSDGVKVKQTSYASFFGYATKSIFDARVVYDKVWNRWVIHAEAFNEDATIQHIFLAASTTSDAAGPYCIYNFDVAEAAGSNDFYDFPQLGMDQDAVIITANIFDSPADGAPYLRSRVFAPPKAAIYNCLGFGVPYINLGAVGTVAPPIVEDNNSNAYLISFFNATTVKLFRGTNLGRSGASVALQANITIPAVTAGPAMRQPGTASTLGPPTGRFQNNSTQIGDALLNIHTIASGSFPTAKWYQFDTEGAGANTLPAGRSGLVLESATSDDSNPHIAGSAVGGTASNPIGRMFVTWNATDAVNANAALRHLVRVKGSGRLSTDGTTISGGTTFTTATAAYNPTADNPERWGDYSAVTIDPVATSTCRVGQRAWIVNERNNTATLWGSRFGRLGYC